MLAVSEMRHRSAVEVAGAFVEHAFKHEGHRRMPGRMRGGDTPARRNRELMERVKVAEAVPLRLIDKLALQMRRGEIDDRPSHLKSRQVKSAENGIPALAKFSAAPSSRSTIVMTRNIVQPRPQRLLDRLHRRAAGRRHILEQDHARAGE